MLRLLALLYGAVQIVIGVLGIFVFHLGWFAGLYLLGYGTLIAVAVFWERGRYNPSAQAGIWQVTGERFTDPTSHQLISVEYNPTTGERRYVPVVSTP